MAPKQARRVRARTLSADDHLLKEFFEASGLVQGCGQLRTPGQMEAACREFGGRDVVLSKLKRLQTTLGRLPSVEEYTIDSEPASHLGDATERSDEEDARMIASLEEFRATGAH
jgi:hypothetical protein